MKRGETVVKGKSLFGIDQVGTIFAPLADYNKILVAVSGGPDSTALLLMLALWIKAGHTPCIEAATVDHGLRSEGEEEAQRVAVQCQKLCILHHTLVWRSEKPISRIQEKAREARYRLLRTCAFSRGAQAIVLAHHADDQAETIVFRLTRGSGLPGLAGMKSLSKFDGVPLIRPLLSFSKTTLVNYCKEQGVHYILDPSNEDARFARVKMRPLMRQLAESGLDREAIARLSRRMERSDQALITMTQQARQRVIDSEDGINVNRLLAEPSEIVLRLFKEWISEIKGWSRDRIRLQNIENLEIKLRAAVQKNHPLAINIEGVQFRLRAERLEMSPENPRRPKGSARIYFKDTLS